MKLKNKKTGEIGNFCYGHTNELCVSWQKDDGFWRKQEYNSLAELNEEWEDYHEELEKIYWIDCDGEIGHRTVDSPELDTKMRLLGNWFETKEQAERAVEKLKAWKRLKDKGFRFEKYEKGDYGPIIIGLFGYVDKEADSLLDLLFGGEDE